MPCNSSGWGLIRSWEYEFVGSAKGGFLDMSLRSATQRELSFSHIPQMGDTKSIALM